MVLMLGGNIKKLNCADVVEKVGTAEIAASIKHKRSRVTRNCGLLQVDGR
jgi:hypothetical protein